MALLAADKVLALSKQAMKLLAERNGSCQTCWSHQGKLRTILLLRAFVNTTGSQGPKCSSFPLICFSFHRGIRPLPNTVCSKKDLSSKLKTGQSPAATSCCLSMVFIV